MEKFLFMCDRNFEKSFVAKNCMDLVPYNAMLTNETPFLPGMCAQNTQKKKQIYSGEQC